MDNFNSRQMPNKRINATSERDPFRGESSSVSLRNKISSYGKDKKDNNQIVKISMVFPPIGVVTHG